MTWDKLERASKKGPESLAVWAGIRFGCLLAVCLLVFGCLGVVGFIANPFKQAGRIVSKTIDADNVIANYEWFKLRYEEIQAIDAKILGAAKAVDRFVKDAGPRKDWHREDREEYSRLTSILLGLNQQRSDLAAEYNARSRMVNRKIFKAGDTVLPEHISVEFDGGTL